MSTRILALFALCAALLIPAGCGSKKPASAPQNSDDDFAADEPEKIDPKEKPFIDAGMPFYSAIAARDYKKAWEHLSSHAKARMTHNQFKAPTNDRETKDFGAQSYDNVSAQKFAELIAQVEQEFGTPKKTDSIHVFSTDAKVLARKSTEDLGALDSMFAIGAMPDSIPANIRKASLRGQIITTLNAQQFEETAKAYGTSVEDLKKDADFKPYFNLKVVLVEEDGKLKVGYFEFLPPSMLD